MDLPKMRTIHLQGAFPTAALGLVTKVIIPQEIPQPESTVSVMFVVHALKIPSQILFWVFVPATKAFSSWKPDCVVHVLWELTDLAMIASVFRVSQEHSLILLLRTLYRRVLSVRKIRFHQPEAYLA